MGCWDITCALTNLPIQEGDPIRWFFLRPTMFQDSDWEHWWTRWIPFSFPIKGRYDAYGRVGEYPNDLLTQFQVECIRQYAVREETGGDSRFEQPIDKEFPTTMKSIVHACERGFLKLNLPYGASDPPHRAPFKKVHTTAFVVHEEIYQCMVAAPGRRPPPIGTSYRRLQKHGRTGVEMLREAVRASQRRIELEGLAEKHSELKETLDRTSSFLAFQELTSHLESSPDVLTVGLQRDLDAEKWPSLLSFTDEDWQELGRRVFEQNVFFWTMRELRREFYPARYSDQYWYKDNDLNAHRLLLRYTDEMTQRIQAEEEAKAEADE